MAGGRVGCRRERKGLQKVGGRMKTKKRVGAKWVRGGREEAGCGWE